MRLTLGQKFKLLRQNTQKDKREIAVYLKLSLITYTKIEDDFIYPTDRMINKIAKLYDLNYEAFLDVGEP